ncbi:MAG: 3-phosphoglycerate dehydrogenase family protein [Oscillospiraceae bacterium]|nr:3-phosphoglycerate dehydrogenase family protein [Oscillospiraceae bacterium]
MTNILTFNKIAPIGLERFGEGYNFGEDIENPAGIMVRSASMHEFDLPETVLGVARAGAGVNNIPVEDYADRGVVVFNTPGANANSVKELVVASLFLSARKVVQGIEWAKKLKGSGDQVPSLVEKGKAEFAGPEVTGKRLGVVGLGAIGILVANAAQKLGMEVHGYDPFLSTEAAWVLNHHIRRATTLKEIYATCDYISLHVPLNGDTRGMINTESIGQMKDGIRILNFSRAELADPDAIKSAVKSGKVSAYVVDFPTDEVLDVDGIIAIPHLGASTPESEDNCAVMAAGQLKDYIENGSIRNAVCYPDLNAGFPEHGRVCVLHRNIPNVLTKLSGFLTAQGLNIENMLSKSKKDYSYTVLDFDGNLTDETVAALAGVTGVIRVRTIYR